MIGNWIFEFSLTMQEKPLMTAFSFLLHFEEQLVTPEPEMMLLLLPGLAEKPDTVHRRAP